MILNEAINFPEFTEAESKAIIAEVENVRQRSLGAITENDNLDDFEKQDQIRDFNNNAVQKILDLEGFGDFPILENLKSTLEKKLGPTFVSINHARKKLEDSVQSDILAKYGLTENLFGELQESIDILKKHQSENTSRKKYINSTEARRLRMFLNKSQDLVNDPWGIKNLSRNTNYKSLLYSLSSLKKGFFDDKNSYLNHQGILNILYKDLENQYAEELQIPVENKINEILQSTIGQDLNWLKEFVGNL